jgi:hypothetical protein
MNAKRQRVNARSGSPSSSDIRRALWRAFGGALIGAAAVCAVAMTFAYRFLDFSELPRTSTAVVLLGFVGFIYGALRLGEGIALLGNLRSARAQPAVAVDRAKPRSG